MSPAEQLPTAANTVCRRTDKVDVLLTTTVFWGAVHTGAAPITAVVSLDRHWTSACIEMLPAVVEFENHSTVTVSVVKVEGATRVRYAALGSPVFGNVK